MKHIFYVFITLSFIISCDINFDVSSNKGIEQFSKGGEKTPTLIKKLSPDDHRKNAIIFYVVNDPRENPMRYTNIKEFIHLKLICQEFDNIDVGMIAHVNNNNNINIWMALCINKQITTYLMDFAEFAQTINASFLLETVLKNPANSKYKVLFNAKTKDKYNKYPLAHPSVLDAVLQYFIQNIFRSDRYVHFIKIKAHGGNEFIATLPTDEGIKTINKNFSQLKNIDDIPNLTMDNISDPYISGSNFQNNDGLNTNQGPEGGLNTNQGPEGGLSQNWEKNEQLGTDKGRDSNLQSYDGYFGITKTNLYDIIYQAFIVEERPTIGILFLQACNSAIDVNHLKGIYAELSAVVAFSGSSAYIPINLYEKLKEFAHTNNTHFITPYNLQQIFIK